jgi:anthranilate synthase component I
MKPSVISNRACKNSNKPDPIGTPDILLMVSQDLLVFDNLSGKMLLLTHADPSQDNAYHNAKARLDRLVAKLREAARSPETAHNF